MDTFSNAILGLAFLALAFSATFLMYRLWGYPFDHTTLKSSAPRPLMFLHRVLGYVFLGIYVYLMAQMLPRLWTYQVELPARTVAHLTLGMAIGIILIAKISIVRFFKHLESQMAPILGTALLVCTTLLIGLSVPLALKEWHLSRKAAGGAAFSAENLERVKTLLPLAGLDGGMPVEELATVSSLQQGRRVLLKKCVQCHDLRTILIKPRTPDNWVQTVSRMAERSVLTEPISPPEQLFVSTYLIAISPDLQETATSRRQQQMVMEQSKAAVQAVAAEIKTEPAFAETAGETDLAAAKEAFEANCGLCHSLTNVEKSPPGSAAAASELIDRMIDNGLNVNEEEYELIAQYLTKTFVRE